MSSFFLKILNMSISAGWIILAVVLLRVVLKRAPKWINVLLWGIVAVRLICPFSVESVLSLIPSAETINPGIMMDPTPTVRTGVPALNSTINPIIASSLAPAPGASANPLQIWIPVLSIVWTLGIAALILYAAVSYWRLQRRLREAVILRENIYQSEQVDTPFVLGIIKPKIYLPYHMDAQNLNHVVAHEQAHIRRKDHWWKPLGFLLLAIHWFNPLMWLAYVLLCRDIELACDEKVIKELGNEQRADYTQALLACSVNHRMIAACPLAFGEVGVKERIRSVMNYKKPAFWMIVLAIVICTAVAICFLTNPAEDAPASAEDGYFLLIGADGVESIEISGVNSSGGVVNADGSAFENGEKVWLEPLQGVTDLRGYSITAFGKNGEIIYALSIPEGMADADVINLVGSDGWLLAPTEYYQISHTSGVDGPENIVEKQKLTLEDVRSLSQKGDALTWSDFEQYAYIETGSGLYIRVYEIDEMFELWIGGAGPDSEPMYIYLSLADDLDTRIDIRNGGVEEFITADHSEILLTNAINDAILEHNKPSKSDELYHCASFVLLDKQELCICGDTPIPMQVIVYGMALHQAYSFTDTGLYEAQGSHIPVVMTFEEENGVYTLLEYWQPRDGSYYVQDIREKFPDEVEEDALDTQKYILSQKQNCYNQAVRYGGVDVDAVIENLLQTVASSRAYSSNPGAYIDAQPIEYRELTYYGQHTLRYCFERFLQGGQNDLVGHIMALVCQDIMLGWGEGYAIDGVMMTGQDWFDAFQSNVQSFVGQYRDEELKKLYPGAWLLQEIQPLRCGYPPAPELSAEIIKIDPDKIVTEPTDGFGANVPDEWVERDSEMLIPLPEEDTDPNFSMSTDGKPKGKNQIQIVPDP